MATCKDCAAWLRAYNLVVAVHSAGAMLAMCQELRAGGHCLVQPTVIVVRTPEDATRLQEGLGQRAGWRLLTAREEVE